jgi:hypothetical protein
VALIWNGDFSTGDAKQYAGGWEYHGSVQPPPPQYVAVGENVNGVAPPPGCSHLAEITVHPGDTYGGSTGWHTLGRPGPLRAQGFESWFVWAQWIPDGFPGNIDPLVLPFEYHQTKAPYVSVTGPAPINIAASHSGDGMFVTVKGGRDGAWKEWIKTTVDAGYPRNTWRPYVAHVRLHPTDGRFGFYVADKALIPETTCGTMYEETQSYVLFGGYRSQTGTDVLRFKLAGVKEYDDAASAFAWARTLAGTSTPPTHPIHDAVADSVRAASKVSATTNPNIRAALDKSNAALGLIADEVEP